MVKLRSKPRTNYYYIIVNSFYSLVVFLVIVSAILGVLFESYAKLVGQWISMGMEMFSSDWTLNEIYWEEYGRIVSFAFVCMAPAILVYLYLELLRKLPNGKFSEFAYKLVWIFYVAGAVLDIVFYIHTKENFSIIPKDQLSLESSTIIQDWLAMVVKKYSFYALPITGQVACFGTAFLWVSIDNNSLRCTAAFLSTVFVLAVITIATFCVVGLVVILLLFLLAKFVFKNFGSYWVSSSPSEIKLSDGTSISPNPTGADYIDYMGNHYRDLGNGYWERYDDD